MKKILLVLLCLLLTQTLGAVYVRTNIDRDSTNLKQLKIGDRIYLNVNISHTKEDSVYLDRNYIRKLQEDSDFVLISHKKQSKTTENENLTEFDITSTFFEVGAQTIPALKFNILSKSDTTVVYSDSIGVQINSVIEDDTTQNEIKDIVEPISISLTAWDIIFPILVLALIGAIIFILVKRKSGKSIIPPKKEKQIHAHIIALQKLDQLALDKLLERGKLKQFFVRISWICREYLERRYNLPVLESTTMEIKRALKDRGVEYSNKFYKFLLECDKVKYARFHKSINEGQEMLKELENLIMKTKKTVVEK